ncbi:MAG: 3-phosphoserine/phosphohydroxythreonine transaminase, partial [Gammaproteobacteria bacterium]
MSRIYNFSPGPAALPFPVLEQAREELLDWHGYGMSLMEMGHRTASFEALAAQIEADLRDLLNIPSDYHVLFLSGGARIQFAMVPLNLLGEYQSVDYVNTGVWSQSAIKEAKKYTHVNTISLATWQTDPQAAYLHYTSNETIEGFQFHYVPDSTVPLVCDMSSDILCRPLDVSRFGLIYASAQKNMGP